MDLRSTVPPFASMHAAARCARRVLIELARSEAEKTKKRMGSREGESFEAGPAKVIEPPSSATGAPATLLGADHLRAGRYVTSSGELADRLLVERDLVTDVA